MDVDQGPRGEGRIAGEAIGEARGPAVEPGDQRECARLPGEAIDHSLAHLVGQRRAAAHRVAGIGVEQQQQVGRVARVGVVGQLDGQLGRKKDYLEGFLAQKPAEASPGEPGGALYERVIDALKEIYDPEIPVNIYDLGLIYGVEVTADGDVCIAMTLTTPHCPVAESMPGEVELRASAVPGVRDAEVNLVWDPPWGPDRMSDEARLELGML